MSDIIFVYCGKSIGIQAQSNENITAVIDRFCIKANINKEKVYFLYDGKLL